MADDLLLLIALIQPFAGSIVAAVLPTRARNAAAALAGAIVRTGTAIMIMAYPALSSGAFIRKEIDWLPSLGLNRSVRLDGLSWLFAFLILGIGALVVLYARYYMSPEDPVPRFFSFLLAFMGSMLGIVLSGNLVQMAFFWELTSLFSFLDRKSTRLNSSH